MSRPEDLRALAREDYRVTRSYLADHCFLNVPGGGKTPDDVLAEDDWDHFMALPTDVLLRTTDYLGGMVSDMSAQAYAWLEAIPTDPASVPYMFEAALDAHDEFKAAPFIAAHGWYRQATAALRNAFEGMSYAARCAVRNDQSGFQAWRGGVTEPKFGNSIDEIGQAPDIAALEVELGGSALFGNRPAGVMRSLHHDVSRYAHSRPGFANADIWNSNGPVFIGRAFTKFWLDYCDTLLACYILLKIGYRQLVFPDSLNPIAENAGVSWQGLAEQALAKYSALS